MGKLRIIPEGTKFNRLTYIGGESRIKMKRYARFRCECGTEKTILVRSVLISEIKSCGCYNQEVRSIMTAKRNYKHGAAKVDGKRNPLYMLYTSMVGRCRTNKNYLGRGITVCDAWLKDPLSFIEWCKKNGYDKSLQLDRRNNDLGYSPENCRFVTASVNGNNKSNNRVFVYKGQRKTMTELSELFGIKTRSLQTRIDTLGWDIERALNTPIFKSKRWHKE